MLLRLPLSYVLWNGKLEKLRPFSRELMVACYKAANEVFAETSAKYPTFRKVYEPWKKFRDEEVLWFRVAEGNFDQFMASAGNIK